MTNDQGHAGLVVDLRDTWAREQVVSNVVRMLEAEALKIARKKIWVWSCAQQDYIWRSGCLIGGWFLSGTHHKLPHYWDVNRHELGCSVAYAVVEACIARLWPHLLKTHPYPLNVFMDRRRLAKHKALVKEFLALLL